jgi:hypothetical protein
MRSYAAHCAPGRVQSRLPQQASVEENVETSSMTAGDFSEHIDMS